MRSAFDELKRRYDQGDPSVVNNPDILNRMLAYAKLHNIKWAPKFSPDRAIGSFAYNTVNSALLGIPSLFTNQPKTVGTGEDFIGGVGSLLGLLAPGVGGYKLGAKGFKAGKNLLYDLFKGGGKGFAEKMASKVGRKGAKYTENEVVKLLNAAIKRTGRANTVVTPDVIFTGGKGLRRLQSGPNILQLMAPR